MRHALALVSLLLAVVGHGTEPGFYSSGDRFAAIFDTQKTADRVLWFGADLRCDLGLGKIQDGARSPIYLSQEEVEHFLQTERHKAFLVVWCDKSIMWSERKDKLIAEIRAFTSRLGYSRVLLLGAHASGVHVITDFKPPKVEPDGPANRSQPGRSKTN